MLRYKVLALIGQSVDAPYDVQWIRHILKWLHLVDEARRKQLADGIAYAVNPVDVIDLVRRYVVARIPTAPKRN